MGEIIIYAAGNPDLYPLEYYNSETMTYEGVIPSLLESFSEQTEYQVIYYKPGEKDLRAHLEKNEQVDLISGSTEEEEWEGCQPVTLFQSVAEGALKSAPSGTEAAYRLYVTETAPDGFRDALQEFTRNIPEEEQIAMVLEQVEEQPAPAPGWTSWILGGITALCLLFAVAALAFRKKYQKYAGKYMKIRDYDTVTSLLNETGLRDWYEKTLNEKNRALYTLFYFRMDTGYLEQLNYNGKKEEFLKYAADVFADYIAEGEAGARVCDGDIVLLKVSAFSGEDTEWVEEAEARIEAYLQNGLNRKYKTVSVGIYPMEGAAKDLKEILFYSCRTASMAKKRKKGYMLCSASLMKQLDEEARLREDIKDALKNDELELYLQFYAGGERMKIIGGEALVRWDHPERGLLSPERFIPLLEQEGMIPALDYYCLEKVCGFLEEMEKKGIGDFFVSCNFSRKTFSMEDFVDRWEEIVGRYAIRRESLAFELTESILPEDRFDLYRNMTETRKRGIRLFLDDFGEGFTSFYDLREFPVDVVKLDKNLTDQVNTEKGRMILKALVDLGHKMGLQIYAEGVESPEHAKKLQEIGCDAIQGFFFHFPAPLWDIRQKLSSREEKEISQAERSGEKQKERPLKRKEKDKKKIFSQICEILSKEKR